MTTLLWLRGLLQRRAGRTVATATGVAVAVALVGSLAAFIAHSKATMTQRSIENVAVDWQVEGATGHHGAQLLATVRANRDVVDAVPVTFGRVPHLEASSGGTQRVTGAAVVVGIPAAYQARFPGVIRNLIGRGRGVLVAQQTAANLQVGPGDRIHVDRPAQPPIELTVDGVIDLPTADTLFQTVGVPSGSAPSAPPDNVLVVPPATWERVVGGIAATRPDLVRTQVHVRIRHDLPADPAAAYSAVLARANHLEAQLAGAGRIGDNLAATLGSAREDALYAQVLFLFLGLPGAVLAALLTVSVAAAGRDRRRREQALLRVRGATTRRLTGLALAEATIAGVAGIVVGLAAARVIGAYALGGGAFGHDPTSVIGWAGIAAGVGLFVATSAIAVPAWIDARRVTVAAAGRRVDRSRAPRWVRVGADLWLLAAAAVLFWLAARGGYRLVVAPEGVPTISVDYWAFAGPALLWVGSALFTWRVAEFALHHGRRTIGALTHPMTGSLAGPVAASMQRQRRLLARGVALVGVTAAFAASTAVFNATYRHQAGVDAVLTNGADVTVTEPPGADVGPSFAKNLASVSGVARVEPVQHRFAYVGTDLQDLYGLDPATVVDAAKLQNAYFQGGSARQVMALLARHPDNLIVSAETVHDFQLSPGDRITLRLQDARTGRYEPVPFHYIAVGKEFPTAPRDSFLLANRDYVAARTHNDSVGVFLVDTRGNASGRVAAELRRQLGSGVHVTDLEHTRHLLASSLTAVDLSGLTRVELSFALVLGASAAGLVLWLGFAERRRSFAILNALGARPRQLGSFVWTESVFVLVGGLALGAAIGALLSHVLVRILTGVFDPPPEHLSVPWTYLAVAATVGVIAVIVASALALRAAAQPRLSALREV